MKRKVTVQGENTKQRGVHHLSRTSLPHVLFCGRDGPCAVQGDRRHLMPRLLPSSKSHRRYPSWETRPLLPKPHHTADQAAICLPLSHLSPPEFTLPGGRARRRHRRRRRRRPTMEDAYAKSVAEVRSPSASPPPTTTSPRQRPLLPPVSWIWFVAGARGVRRGSNQGPLR